MDQTRARRIAKWTGHVAMTRDQFRGEFSTGSPEWGVQIGTFFFDNEAEMPGWVTAIIEAQEAQ